MRTLVLLFLVTFNSLAFAAAVKTTATGIPLDTDWKNKVYDFAVKNVVHPSWGIAHSERDYQVAKSIAEQESLDMDLDVLFATAFLHDFGGLAAFEAKGVDHAVQSAKLAEPLLKDWGYPMDKFPAVKDMILGHTYYGPVPQSKVALAFRDADVLDFLGAIGVARIFAATMDPGFSDGTLKPTLATLREFEQQMAGKCSLQTCKTRSVSRQSELTGFLKNIDGETIGGLAE